MRARLNRFLNTCALLSSFCAATSFATAAFKPAPYLTEEPNLASDVPSSCSAVDYRSQLPRNRSQGDSDFCYAYSGATLIQQRTGIDISALDVAMAFYFVHPDQLLRSHDPELAQYLRDDPTWLQHLETVRSDVDVNTSVAGDGKTVTRPFFHRLSGGEEDVAMLLLNARPYCVDADFPADKGFSAHDAKIKQLIGIAETRSDLPRVPEVDGAFPKFREPVADVFNSEWIRYMDQRCHRVQSAVATLPHRFFYAKDYRDFEEKVRTGRLDPAKVAPELFKIINFALDHGRVPSIGYSYFNLAPHEPNDPDLYADHSSPIVARKTSGGQCFYLIRDPSGAECDEYFPPYQKRCKNGEVWVTQNEIMKSLYSVVYLR